MYAINVDFASGILQFLIYVYYTADFAISIRQFTESGTSNWLPIRIEGRERAHASARERSGDAAGAQPPGAPCGVI